MAPGRGAVIVHGRDGGGDRRLSLRWKIEAFEPLEAGWNRVEATVDIPHTLDGGRLITSCVVRVAEGLAGSGDVFHLLHREAGMPGDNCGSSRFGDQRPGRKTAFVMSSVDFGQENLGVACLEEGTSPWRGD